MAKPISLEKILFSQGFGTRRFCSDLVYADLVKVNGVLAEDPEERIPTEGLMLNVEGKDWEFHEKAYIAFNKPPNYECSHKTTHHPSVYSLLPKPFVERGLQCVGRLDFDTTGLILISDDGQFIHRLSSPKWKVPKVYEVTCKHKVDDAQIAELLKGVQLIDEPTPIAALACSKISDTVIHMTLAEGKYHQVKRMLAAAGNHCTALSRVAIGELALQHLELELGEWCFLEETELALLR